MFGWGLALLSALLMSYLAWRLASLPWVALKLSKRQVGIVSGILWILMAVGRMLGHDATFPGASVLEFVGMTLLGVLFLCCLPLLVVDIGTAFGHWFRHSSQRWRGWALLSGLGLSAFASIQGLREPEVVTYEVNLPGLPGARDGLMMVALSDLHLGAILGPKWLAARIAQVQSLQPDLVVLLGDVFEGQGRPEPMSLELLQRLHAPLGVWGVDGNHELHGTEPSPLDEGGVQVLRNGLAVPSPGLVLAGRAPDRGHGRAKPGPAWTIPLSRPEGALVLLSHIPNQVSEAASAGVGLMLSGHTHAGQIWPLGYLVGLAYPPNKSPVQVQGMTLIVNRGTGTWGPRMRLWRRGEISLIRLRSVPADPPGRTPPTPPDR